MQTILVATDNIEGCNKALDQAKFLSVDHPVYLGLLYVQNTKMDDDPNATTGLKDAKETNRQQIHAACKHWMQKEGQLVELLYSEDAPGEAIPDATARLQANLVILAFGDNVDQRSLTYAAIENLPIQQHVSVLIMKANATPTPLQQVGLVNDFANVPDMFDLGMLLTLGSRLGFALHILNVPIGLTPASLTRLAQPLKLRWQLKSLHPTLSYAATSQTNEVGDWAEKYGLNLLVLVAHKDGQTAPWMKQNEQGICPIADNLPVLLCPPRHEVVAKKEPCKQDTHCKSCPDCKQKNMLSGKAVADLSANV